MLLSTWSTTCALLVRSLTSFPEAATRLYSAPAAHARSDCCGLGAVPRKRAMTIRHAERCSLSVSSGRRKRSAASFRHFTRTRLMRPSAAVLSIVTGANRGIGLAASRALARHGANHYHSSVSPPHCTLCGLFIRISDVPAGHRVIMTARDESKGRQACEFLRVEMPTSAEKMYGSASARLFSSLSATCSGSSALISYAYIQTLSLPGRRESCFYPIVTHLCCVRCHKGAGT